MFKCSECKRVYKDKVDYCDCGNNVFEEIPDASETQSASESDKSALADSAKPILPLNLVSIIVFSLCCVFSLCFVLFMGPENKKQPAPPTTNQKSVVKEIPTVDKIWDDTPAYAVPPSANENWASYQAGLINSMLSKFELEKFEGGGTCDVEFVLDKHGNLKKKKLYQNSANKPLLAAAKKMLSSVRSYNPPPLDYDGRPVTLEFYDDNDTYKLRVKN